MKTTNKLSPIFKIISLFLIFSIFLISCQNEEITEEEEISDITFKTVSFSKFSTIKKLKPLIKNIKEKRFNKNGSDDSFVIDTTNITETSNGNIKNYSFNLKRTSQSSNVMEKFIISETNEEYSYYISTFLLRSSMDDVGLISITEIEDSLISQTKSDPIDAFIAEHIPCIDISYISSPRDFGSYTTIYDLSGCGKDTPIDDDSGSGGLPNVGVPNHPVGPGLGGAIGLSNLDRTINALGARLNIAFTSEQEQWLRIDDNAQIIADFSHTFSLYNATEEYLQNIQDLFINLINELLNNNINANEIPIADTPDLPINNINEFIECFDTSQPAKLTIYIDQPISNSNIVVSANSVGHAFIGISQGENNSTFGFYPNNDDTTPWNTDAPPVFGDDSTHAFDVSLTINITATQLNDIINLSTNFNDNYDLNDNNCTDFAIEIGNLGGLSIGNCNSNWILGSGSNPAKLGQTVRNMDNLPDGAERDTNGGYPIENNKDC